MIASRILAALVAACIAPCAFAQYPAGDRPIRLIVPFAAGSGTDTASRLLSEALSPAIRRPIIVENRPGAGATIGTAAAAKSPPDGFTLVMVGGTAVTSAQFLFRNLGYDPITELAPVYYVASSPLALFVNADSPYRSFADFLAAAKAEPGRITYGAHTVTSRVATEVFRQHMGMDLVYVPYKSLPQALNDIGGGVLATIFGDLSGSAPFVASGKVRALALMKRSRSPRMAGVPTVYELGYQGHEVINWTGVFAPARTPGEIIGYLAREIRAIADRPDFRERFERVGLDLNQGGTPEAFAAFVRQDHEAMGSVIRRLGITPE